MKDISADGFQTWQEEVLDASESAVVVAYFTAPWCGPCRMLKPVLEQLESENEGLTIVRIDVDSNTELARDFKLMSVPQLWFYQAGHEEHVIQGIKPKQVLQTVIDELPQRT